MKHLLFIAISLLFSYCGFAQTNNNWDDKYYHYNLTSLSLTKIIEESGFKPIKITQSMTTFKALILQLDAATIQQLNINTWAKCSKKHEEYFQLYNLYYKPITRLYYDSNCKELIALMEIDGTAIQTR